MTYYTLRTGEPVKGEPVFSCLRCKAMWIPELLDTELTRLAALDEHYNEYHANA